jgi:predicted DNA-binding protein YlxM (UPF0122 family)
VTGLDPQRAKELRKAERDLAQALERYEAATAARNQLVRQALADRYTMQEVADAMGISRQRIGQIAAAPED